MTKHYDDGRVAVHHGHCLDVLRTMPDSSVDAVVTDPPYGLSATTPAGVTKALQLWATGDREHVPDGKGFMGKDWDAFVPPPAVWDECYRVLKPGGHLLAFAGSGTTAEACVLEGLRCVAIERDADYLPLIVARLVRGDGAGEPDAGTVGVVEAVERDGQDALFDLGGDAA